MAARRESDQERHERAAAIDAVLAETYPEAECALRHENAYQLLVATILSAQCTDARVNLVTPELFRRWPDAAALARVSQGELETVIRSTGFYRNKAKNLLGMAQGVVERHGGEIPDTMETLTALPGAARKTANVLLGTWFGKNEGVVVDTHVQRLSARFGLTRHDAPVKIEEDLMELLPRAAWTDFGHRLILHGRRICTARKPKCAACPANALCPSREDVPEEKKTLTRTARGVVMRRDGSPAAPVRAKTKSRAKSKSRA